MAKIIDAGVASAGVLLHVVDDFEFLAYQALAQRVYQLRDTRDKNMAIEFANAIGKMLGLIQ